MKFDFLSQSYFGLHGPLGDRMFDLVSQQRRDQKLTFEDLVIAKVSSCGHDHHFFFLVTCCFRTLLNCATKAVITASHIQYVGFIFYVAGCL